MGISAPYKSVPVIKLINTHKPQSYSELESLIEYHYLNECECRIKSKGTVYDFGKNLFNAQMMFWGENKFTLEECIQWEYDLFIINSLKGSEMENKAVNELKEKLSDNFEIVNTEGYVDEEYRVDIEIKRNNEVILGIQVKPSSYKYMRCEVKNFNTIRNAKYKKDVKYLYYDDAKKFINLDDIIQDLTK
ncbi:MAG: MjaI family restriction endonuclease [Methanobrevibacter sp.]|nr:MjaI family restriction endonuclease [Methanobrevibacter sp.]